jgi:hypothetical protein
LIKWKCRVGKLKRMGSCCTCQRIERFDGFVVEVAAEERGGESEDGEEVHEGEFGARVRLQGSSKYVAMFSQQGRKGTNQDAMTVWEVHPNDLLLIICYSYDKLGPFV